MTERWISLAGLVVFLLLAWGLSSDRKRFPWRVVLWAIALQFLIGLFILKTRPGLALFEGFQQVVTRFTGFATEGTRLVFGPMADGDSLEKVFGPGNGFVLAVTFTGIIVLVSAVSSLLYHYGILHRVVWAMAWVMERTLRTSGSESLAAAANIFMGQTEAPLVIRPYLERMTRSELFCLMTGGFATIAGSVLALYVVALKIPAGALLTASVMSAPAALMISKVMRPETEASETAGGARAIPERTSQNGIDAICTGAADGMKLAINVVAMLIAFTALVAIANYLLGTAAGWIGWSTQKPLQELLGYLNAPFALLMGVAPKDSLAIGQMLGERIVLNEFFGYMALSQNQATLDPRSYQIAVYALCGFANFGSVAIQIGGISALVPSRRTDLAQLGMKAMIGGLLACYCTACVAGVLL